jgi:putative transposase
MPRTARASVGGVCYHVINRGNGRTKVFHKAEDYEAFVVLLGEAAQRASVRLLAYCLMPNHFHLVLWPRHDGGLSRFMQWLLTAHVRRYHRHYHGSGHVWQGRFKAFPIQQDEHLLTVLRYVERNALRAGLVARAEDWAWSSLDPWRDRRRRAELLSEGPVERGSRWVAEVNLAMTREEEEALRRSVNRGTPWGDSRWQSLTAVKLALESTLRPRGRPRKEPPRVAKKSKK